MRLRQKVEIVVACVVVPCALELFSASRVLRWLERLPPRRPRNTGTGGDAIGGPRLAHHVDRLLMRAPAVWHYTCLRRTVVLAALLRRDGRRADVVFGVRRRADGSLEAHAWLRCGDEEPFLEHGDVSGYEALRGAS